MKNKYCDDPDHCTYSDCPAAFCDRNLSTYLLKRLCSAWKWCVDFAGCLILFCLPLLLMCMFALLVALIASPFTILRKMNIEI